MTNSRRKGAEGERELSRILRGYGVEARRGQQFCGANGDADVVGLEGFHIEVKRVERGAGQIHEWIHQSERDARDGEVPTVFHRKNREGWVVTMRLDDWMNLIGRSNEAIEWDADEIMRRD